MVQKNLPALIQPEVEDAEFLRMLEQRVEYNRMVQELTQLRLALRHSEITRRKEKRAARREINAIVAFVGVGACAVAMTVCMVAAPWWTAIAPLLLALAILQKSGW